MKFKKHRFSSFLRLVLVALMVVLQVILVALLVDTLRKNALYIYIIIEITALIEILVLISQNRNSEYTIGWIVVIALLPVFGQILYFLWGRPVSRRSKGSMQLADSIEYGKKALLDDSKAFSALSAAYPMRKRIGGYLKSKGYPVYENTDVRYFKIGEDQFEQMLFDIENAQRFVFLEYFIVSEGKLWDRFEELLKKKAAQGVEVRLMYDDFGSILTLGDGFMRRLEANGIKVVRFNPIHKYISRLYINYRNHQKICVIDGQIGYTGGTNLADEYANYYPKHGHWKDAAIRLEGDAVLSLTVNFLEMWDGSLNTRSNYDDYKAADKYKGETQGFIQPFADGPLSGDDNPAELVYRTIISNAQRYVYITTPYLVISTSMMDTLIAAAESGVDVRIITPKIWDHWYVHAVTRSNYAPLLKAGVRIYEYTPGYIHAKTIISDDEHAVTGSINMDYRSFNLHYENGVWICGSPVLSNILSDINETFQKSEEIKLFEHMKRPFYIRFIENTLRIFAIFM
ncbi:MAG: cardiolipin synthase [Clostridia bacterium]|nr:cardiolipin synthase [Clostridia bacterium]